MKYEGSQKDCKPCSIGYTSEQESSLSCIKCPEKKSTRKEGSKTCEGKHNSLGVSAIVIAVLSLSSLNTCLSVCFPSSSVLQLLWFFLNSLLIY